MRSKTNPFAPTRPPFHIDGYDVHPGYAKDKMVNAVRVAAFIVSLFPPDALPETTEGRQGYLHPYEIEGGRHPGAGILSGAGF